MLRCRSYCPGPARPAWGKEPLLQALRPSVSACHARTLRLLRLPSRPSSKRSSVPAVKMQRTDLEVHMQ